LGRKAKTQISEEDLTALDSNEVGAKELSEKYGVDNQYIHNIKHKRKLKTNFKLNLADQAMSTEGAVTASENNLISSDQEQQEGSPEAPHIPQAPQIDPAIAVKGLYKGADMVLKLMAVMSRGKLKYTNVPDDELDKLTELTKNDQGVQKVANIQGLSSIIVVGSIAHTFGSRMELVKEEKHKKDDLNCKCKTCVKNRKSIEEQAKEIKEIVNITKTDPVEKILEKEVPVIEPIVSSNLSETAVTEDQAEELRGENGLIMTKNEPKKDLVI
jgi:hypothetical protein